MAWKLLRLTPLKPFFFGKQKIFTNTSYASSEYCPQQTQILGALRAYLLETNGYLKVHKHGKFCAKEENIQASSLVGTTNAESFAINDNENCLGKIDFISPMFINKILKDNKLSPLFQIPNDIVEKYNSTTKKKYYEKVIPKKIDSILSNNKAVLLQNYDVKKGFTSGFGNSEFWKKYINNEKIIKPICDDFIFQAYKQVGIGLEDYGKKVKEQQFYTKKSYMLKPSFEFGILLNLQDDTHISDGIITLGAENSTFKLVVEDVPSYFEEHPIIKLFQNPFEIKEGKKIVLMSDSILQNSIQQNSYYQISSKVPFKMMSKTTLKTELKSLVAKGSIYYFDENTSLPQALGAYKKMGFNQYLVID